MRSHRKPADLSVFSVPQWLGLFLKRRNAVSANTFYFTTRFTSRPGTMIVLMIDLPSREA